MEGEKYQRSVEALLSELHNPVTSNARRHEIDQILLQFRHQQDATSTSLYLLENSASHSVLLFSLGVIEYVVNRKWLSLSEGDRLVVRERLLGFLLSSQANAGTVPLFVKKKLVKVVVDIGLADWPQRYPDFFDTILKLMCDSSKSSLGLLLGVAITEEFTSPKADLEMSRKEELNRLYFDQVSHLIDIIASLLEEVSSMQQHTVAPTPPSSPQYIAISGHPMAKTSLQTNIQQPLQPLDEKSEEICILGLECLTNVFNCVPLVLACKPNLIRILFHFVGLGCLDATNAESSGPGLGSLALGCVNELLLKKLVPQECDVFVIQMLEEAFLILKYVTEAEKQSSKFVSFLDERFLKKLLDFLLCFAESHIKRMERSTNFPLPSCLIILQTFTSQLPQLHEFSSCLTCWEMILDFLGRGEEKVEKPLQDKERYKSVIFQFADDLCRKIRLGSLDCQTSDEDTEWTELMSQAFYTLETIAHLYPSDALEMLTRSYSNRITAYFSLENIITISGEVSSLKSLEEKDRQIVHLSLVGLAVDLQALSSMANCFIGAQFLEYFPQIYSILESFCQVISFSMSHCLHRLQSSRGTQALSADFLNVHVHALLAVQGFCHWIAQFYLESSRQKEHEDKLVSLLLTILSSSLPLLNQEAPERLHMATARVFASIAKTVRPRYLLDLEPVQLALTNTVDGRMTSVSSQVQILVYKALSDALLLPWPDMSDAAQNWAGRSSQHTLLLKRLIAQFIEVCQATSSMSSSERGGAVAGFITQTVGVLRELLDSIRHETNQSKAILHSSIKNAIDPALHLFPLYKGETSVVDTVLSFFHSLFDCLKIQLGPESTLRIVETIMSFFDKEYMQMALLSDQLSGCQFTERFLQLLGLLVQEPGSKFAAFSPKILIFCLQEILPVSTLDHPGVRSALLGLFHDFVINRWKYFFSGSTNEHNGEFATIMEALRESLSQSDVSLVRQSLQVLDDLNSKCKLYERNLFKEGFLCAFVCTLLKVLIEKSHALLQDELLATLFTLASVNFSAFYELYLPGFLVQIEEMTGDQKQRVVRKLALEKDWPSFVQMITSLTNDIHYFLVCNTSLVTHSAGKT